MRPDTTGNRQPAAGNHGFVLPTTLLVMTLLTIMLTAAFTMVSAEFRTTDNSMGRSRAHALAQAGLQNYYALNRTLSGGYDSVRLNLNSGYADVIARELRDSSPTQRAVWLIRSTAVSIDALLSNQVAGRRTIVQLAEYNYSTFPTPAAFYAINGMRGERVVGAGTNHIPVLGLDTVTSFSPRVDKNGLVFPTGLWSEAVGNTAQGSPFGHLGLASQAAVLAMTRIDWVSLVNNYTPDYNLPAGPVVWNINAVIKVTGDYVLDGSVIPDPSSGVLIVTGNLRFANNPHFNGALLVGGYLSTGLGNYRIHGMTVTGLNLAFGAVGTPRDTIQRLGGTREFHWRTCEYNAAIAPLAGLVPIGNAWADTWSSY